MPAGRPRKPEALHILEGTFKPCRHGDPADIAAVDGEPQRPANLTGEARKLWNAVVPELVSTGVAKARDTAELASMCEWWKRYRKLSAAVDRMAVTAKGYWRLFGLLAQAQKAFDACGARFGMSPVDRARLRGVVVAPKKAGVMSRERKAGGAG